MNSEEMKIRLPDCNKYVVYLSTCMRRCKRLRKDQCQWQKNWENEQMELLRGVGERYLPGIQGTRLKERGSLILGNLGQGIRIFRYISLI